MRGDRYGTGFPAGKVHRIPAATLERRTPLGAASTGITLLRGIAAARAVLRRAAPAVVAGFGGYPTVPPLIAAVLARVPTALHEQNAVMGRANRLLARLVTGVALSFEDTHFLPAGALAKARLTGNPVRAAVIEAGKRPYAPPTREGPFRVVVFGGSQGAHYFAELVPAAFARLSDSLRRRIVVVQQAREEDIAAVRAAYRETGTTAEVAPFFNDLADRIAAAHLVVARSGASTVAELAVLGRPSLLVPFPHALDKDQFENATRLQQAGGAWCVSQSAMTPERLADTIRDFAQTPDLLAKAAAAARGRGKPDAVALLADMIEELAAGHRR